MSGRARIMLAMANNSPSEEIHCALAEDKRAVEQLEAEGLVVVRRTTERCGGLIEWWFRLAPVASGRPDASPASPRQGRRSKRSGVRAP